MQGAQDVARPEVTASAGAGVGPHADDDLSPVGKRKILHLLPNLGMQAAGVRMLGPFDLADQQSGSVRALGY